MNDLVYWLIIGGLVIVVLYLVLRRQRKNDLPSKVLERLRTENHKLLSDIEKEFDSSVLREKEKHLTKLQLDRQQLEIEWLGLEKQTEKYEKDLASLEAYYFNALNEKEGQVSEIKEALDSLNKEIENSTLLSEAKKQEIEILEKELEFRKASIQSLLKEQKRNAMEDNYYKLAISEQDKKEIAELEGVAARFGKVRSAIFSAIYSYYFAAAVGSLLERVVGSRKVSGVYKITNSINGEVYVGRSVDIRNRWTQHIKRAVGSEKETQNKLYPSMREYGVWNFTFEILQEAHPDDLPALERFYQEVYLAKEDLSVK